MYIYNEKNVITKGGLACIGLTGICRAAVVVVLAYLVP